MKIIFKKLLTAIVIIIVLFQTIPSTIVTSGVESIIKIQKANAQDFGWTFDDTVTTSDCLWGCDNSNSFSSYVTCWDGSRAGDYYECPTQTFQNSPASAPNSNSWTWQDTCATNPYAVGCISAQNPVTPAPTEVSNPSSYNNGWTWQDTCATNPNAVGCISAQNNYYCSTTGSYVPSSSDCPSSTGPVAVPTPPTINNGWTWQDPCVTNPSASGCRLNNTTTYIAYPTVVYNPTIVSNSYTPSTYSWGSWGITNPTTVYTPPTISPAPTIQQYRCWDNSIVTNIANCPTQTKTCSGGIVVPINSNCPAQTKTCPNGTIIPIDQTCPAQTKTCANGIVVGINDICYKTCSNGYTYPESSVCPTPTCSNGAINPSVCNQCQSGYEFINNKCLQVCASGYTRNGESCDRVTYRCAGGEIVYNQADCPPTTCNNGATNPPTCNQFPSCNNGAINSPTCNQCANGYEMWSNRCVAICQTNYIRNSNTGACDLRVCTNGANNSPMCNTCPSGQEMFNNSCTPVCPANTYRTSSGCIAYTCTNGATNYSWCNICPTGKYMINNSCQSCGQGQSFDGWQCVNNQCTNGAINSPSCNQCSVGYEFTNNKCLQPCPTGYVRSGDSCNLIPMVCNNGATNSPACNQCATGYEFVESRCLQICPTGYLRNGLNCQMQTRTCWDNSQVLLTQSCPPEYKFCSGSGTSVLVTQSCPVVPVPITPTPVTPPIVVNTHRVVTTPVTSITDKSARCNGVAIISNNKNSNGWFEYGITPQLGNMTSSGYIGSASNVTFAGPLSGLKPNTKYYCRAAMSNADGTWRGDIVEFVTASTPIKYIETPKPIVTKNSTNKKSDIEKITYTSTTYTCKDNAGGAVEIKSGEKLMTVNIIRDGNSIDTNKNTDVKIEYKNTSKINLNDVVVKVAIPDDIEVVSTSQGKYDSTLKEVYLNISELVSGQSGVILLTVKAKDNSQNAKTIVLTAYANYFLTTSSGDAYKDETSTYVIYQIVNDGSALKDTSNLTSNNINKKIVTTNSSFLPNTFLGWISLIVILFILVIVGRTLWSVWKSKASGAHH